MSGCQVDFHGPSQEKLASDKNLFDLEYLDTMELIGGNYIFDPTCSTGIPRNDFIVLAPQNAMVNWNHRPMRGVATLNQPAIKTQIMQHLAERNAQLEQQLKDKEKELQQSQQSKLQVQTKYSVCNSRPDFVFI